MNDSKIGLLAGRSWLHQGKVISITSVNEKNLRVETAENGGIKFESLEDLEYFAEKCKPVETGTGIILVDTKSDDIMSKLLAGMVEDFDTLKEKPEYVEQAKQRSSQVRTIIDLTKLKLQLLHPTSPSKP